MTGGIAISTSNLTRNFGDLVAVDHINLEVPEACIYGFLGPNGCGKSTTIRMLCGLLTPSEGDATVLGLDIKRDAEKLKKAIRAYLKKHHITHTTIEMETRDETCEYDCSSLASNIK